MRAAVALSLAFVAHAGATATYDYKAGKFLVIGSQWQVKERDPSATLGQYGGAEKLEQESDESAALYHVWFDAEGECELLPADKTGGLSTQPVKEQKTNE
jgi:hypothetical protein